MPMIDVHLPDRLVAADRRGPLATALVTAVLRAEGTPLAEPFLSNTAVFLHDLPVDAVSTGAEAPARAVRVVVTTPPGALSREGQRELVAAATAAVADAAGDLALAGRTWVVLQEAAEGGWGVAGTALGRDDFAALAAAGRR